MPEIAEVRVVANTLKKQLLNKKITKVHVYYDKMIENEIDYFMSNIENKTIKDIKTYGKWIMFDLGDKTMLSHLRMEGKYFYVPNDTPLNKHIHVTFELDDGCSLRYQDVRKFGKMKLVDTDKVFEDDAIKKLGLEPDDKNLNASYLISKLKNKAIPIKEALLDQTIINGLGNIYANEVLYTSRINPFKPSSNITMDEASRIIDASNKIITRSYELGGCTIRSYTSSLGVIGHYQDELFVQSRQGLPCRKCNAKIMRKKLNGRSVFYCPNCQK